MRTEPHAGRPHACAPDADRLIERIGAQPNSIRILTFWSLEPAYPSGRLRYHLGQLGMLRLMNDLADRGCAVDALICDSQSRSIVGGSVGYLEQDIQTTESFINRLRNIPVNVRRMSQLVEYPHEISDPSQTIARRVVNGALMFRNSIQRHRPPQVVLDRLDRFRNCVELPELDGPTQAYLSKLTEFRGIEQLDLLAALYASVRRPIWFDAFWLGEIAAWVAKQAQKPNTVILEANRSAYSWLTHRCFLAIGAIDKNEAADEPPWPAMYFVDPILSIDGKAPMQLSVPAQAIFLHHTCDGLKDRLEGASHSSLVSYRDWFLNHLTNEMDDGQLRHELFSRIQSLRAPIQDLSTRSEAENSKSSSPPDKVRIGLCLSGGGFRATFFHLGLVKLLRDLELLKDVVGVYSVSGGSILAANLATRWHLYSKHQDDATFFEALGPLRKLGQADIRGSILRRSFWFGARTDRLADYYDDIGELAKTELGKLPSEPDFSFLGTSMKSGKLVSFTRKGYHNGNRLFASPDFPLSRAVAASSAFPPLFPPMWVSEKDLIVDPDSKEGVGPVTDGGVFDNLGLTKLMSDIELRADVNWCTVALVSDASAPFEASGADRFRWMFNRTARATDILMKRVGDLEVAGRPGPSEAEDEGMQIYCLDVRINSIVGGEFLKEGLGPAANYSVQDERIQALTAKIRTDLDHFSDEEVASLIRHGYEVGLASLARAGMVPRNFQPRDPCGVPFPRLDIFESRQSESPVTDRDAAVKAIRAGLEHSGVRRLGIFKVPGKLFWWATILIILALAVWAC